MLAADIRDRVVELRRVRANEIVPHEKNAREHPDAQRNALRAVMGQLGFAGAILAVERDGKLKCCDGHLRTEEMGDREVPVLVLDLNDDEVETLLLSYDSVGAMAKFDRDRLDALLASYDRQKSAFDPSMLNGMQADLDKMLAALAKESGSTWGKSQEAVQDEVPEPPVVAVTEAGDLWVLGRHRILSGNATTPQHLSRLFGAEIAAMVFTDPPYGVAYRDTGAGAWNEEKLAKKKAGTLHPRFDAIANDDLSEEDLFAFLVSYMTTQAQFIGERAAQYVCHASLRAHVFREALIATGYVPRAEIIWAKSRPGFNFANYKHKHEPIYYAAPDGKAVDWYGDATQTTLWEIGSESGAVYEHPTQKPVGLAFKAISNSSQSGDVVYEPFSGSFSTGIACEQLGRRCFALEIDPRYVDVAAERWGKFTGQEPILEGTGETFSQVKERRTRERAENPAPTPPAETPSPEPSPPVTIQAPQRQEPRRKAKKHSKR